MWTRARCLAIGVVVGCGGGAGGTDEFVGSWAVTMLDGMPTSGDVGWTFTATTVTVGGLDGTYTVRADRDPQEIDVSFPGVVPDPALAIYVFDGPDTVTLKIPETATAPRPTTFEVETDYDLEVLVRQ